MSDPLRVDAADTLDARKGSKLFPVPCDDYNNAGMPAPVWDGHNADIRMSGSRHCVICALPFTA
jgi:hypothetical protein